MYTYVLDLYSPHFASLPKNRNEAEKDEAQQISKPELTLVAMAFPLLQRTQNDTKGDR